MFNNSNNSNNSYQDNNNSSNEDRVDQFSKQLFGNLVAAAKISNNLPTEEDYSYYQTFPEFKNRMDHLGKRLLNLTQNFVQSENPKTELSLTDTSDVDELSERFSGIVDVVDGMIDKVDKTIDPKYNQNQTNIFISSTVVQQNQNKKSASNEVNMFYGSNIARPQLKFEDPIDNNNFPFLPKIKSKPNSLVDLDPIFKKSQPKDILYGKIIRDKEQESLVFPHPYEYEINNFKYTDKQIQHCKEILSRSLEDTPYTWIDSVRQLEELCDKLSHVEEFAMDLEHHNYRSYQGFVCLMQISTRTEDFIIDTLALRSHIHMLNNVTTNPSIIKVLHGSDSDIKWLQRDFGIYIVNMFDTGQASRVLEYPSASLAFLLKYFCAVDANKKYQLADWRIRKIPEEMIKYAREDTHYLLYIYDRLRNELISKGKGTSNLLLEVLRRSRELALLKYEKEILDDATHIQFAKKLNLQYNPVQLNVLKVIYHWRENLAREEDESVRYVLPNQMMLSIVENQPVTVQELLALCSPVPPSLKQHAHQLIQDILKARIEDSSKQQQFIPALHNVLSSQSNLYYNQKQQQIQQQQIQQQQLLQQQQQIIQQQQLQIQQQQQQIIQQQQQQNQQKQLQQSQQSQQKDSGRLSPVPNIKNNNSSSPVLSTDQLYKTAKWLSGDNENSTNLQPAFQSMINNNSNNNNNNSKNNIQRKSTTLSSANQNNHSNSPISNSSLFDTGSGDEENPERKRSKRIASMVASSFEPSSFAPVFKPSTQLKAIDQQQQQNQSSSEKEDEILEQDNQDDDEEQQDDAMEQDEEGEKSSKSCEEEEATSDKESENEDDDDINSQVPKSMQEIYQLSNLNRRRNKEKKKLKENSTTSSTTSLIETKSKKDESSVTDTFSFLKEIGWVNSDQSADSFKPVSQQPQPSSTTTTTTTTSSSSSSSSTTNNNQSPITQSLNTQQQQQQQLSSTKPNNQQISPQQQAQQPITNKKQNKQSQQSNPSPQPQQQQQFVSFDYSQVSNVNQSNPNQQQNFFNTDYQTTKKKSSQSTGSVKAKSGTFYPSSNYKKK